jgi:ADP-dependent NAD(P)H-hydrate dehydratase
VSVRKRSRSAGASVVVDDRCLRDWPLPLPGDDADKEDRGRLLVIGGSREIGGAVVLAGMAAMRAGAGKVAIATARSVAPTIVPALPEARIVALDETPEGGLVLDDGIVSRHHDAILIGPGMQDAAATIELVARVVDRCPSTPLVLDAQAMDFVRERGGGSGTILITPHAGELAHLTGRDKDELLADPEEAALRHAREWRVAVALKGAVTIVATAEGRSWRHDGGNIGLAASGSGDVLAGIVAGLAARGAALEQAAAWAVALHSRAGDRLVERYGRLGFLARELCAEVPRLMHELSQR